VQYVPGRNLHIADALSRAHGKEDSLTQHLEDALSGQVLAIDKCFSGDSEILQMLRAATSSDSTRQKLKTVIQSGWPEHKSQLPAELRRFWDVRHDFTYAADLLCHKDRIYVPVGEARRRVLSVLHVAHPGIVKMDLKAKDYFYWPGMRTDIEDTVSRCEACQMNMRSQSKETLMSVDIPDFPFQVCATDLFVFEGDNYLLYVDSYSHWMSFTRLRSTTSGAVTKVLQEHFANFGLPEQLISDGGPQFSSEDFGRMLRGFNIQHRKSSPTYAQSNGLAERYVQTAKSMLRKCRLTGQSLTQALLHHRNTPVGRGFPSPAEMAFGRRLRCNIPASVTELRPREMFVNESVRAFEKARSEAAQRYNQGAHSLKPLTAGDPVWLQRGKRDWVPAQVVERVADSTRSYIVSTEHGQQFRRNRRFLRPRQSQQADGTTMQDSAQVFDELQETQESARRVGESLEEPTVVENSSQPDSAQASEPTATETAGQTGEYRTARGRIVRPTNFFQAGE
jgi:hypothetical protein